MPLSAATHALVLSNGKVNPQETAGLPYDFIAGEGVEAMVAKGIAGLSALANTFGSCDQSIDLEHEIEEGWFCNM